MAWTARNLFQIGAGNDLDGYGYGGAPDRTACMCHICRNDIDSAVIMALDGRKHGTTGIQIIGRLDLARDWLVRLREDGDWERWGGMGGGGVARRERGRGSVGGKD